MSGRLTDPVNIEKSRPRNAIYELFMLGLCTYVLAALAAVTFFRLDRGTVAILNYVDTGICLIFLGDFVFNLANAPNKLHYLRWGWIDLVSSIPAIGPLRWGRLARVVRILRLLRGVRVGQFVTGFTLKNRANSAFAAAALTAILLISLSSVAILQMERGSTSGIQTAEDALWWSFVTVTTVGYGDEYPVTTGGRLVGVVTMTIGVGLFGTFAGCVAAWFLEPGEEEQEDELEAIRVRLDRIEQQLERIANR